MSLINSHSFSPRTQNSQMATLFSSQPGAGGEINRLLSMVEQAQSGGIDKASTVLTLLKDLRESQDPTIARIGESLRQLDDRLGGRFTGDKQNVLLQNMSTLLKIETGEVGHNAGKAPGNY